MEILGIGPSELVFIIVIALIVLGPKDMQKAGKTIGGYLNKLIKSDGWKAFQQTSREIRNLPTNLMREANMDMAETEKEIRKSLEILSKQQAVSTSNQSPSVELKTDLPQPQVTENSILPPSATNTPTPESAPTNVVTNNDNISTPDQNA